MKNIKKSNKLLVGVIAATVASTLAISPWVVADESTPAPATAVSEAHDDKKAEVKKEMKQQETHKKAIDNQEKKQNELLEKVNNDVVEGFDKVVDATKLLKDGKAKEAIEALEVATGKFDIALAADPNLGLIPINASVNVTSLVTTPALVRSQIKMVRDLLSESRVQTARAILLALNDEIVASTRYVPMSTYPDAIKQATKALVEDNKDAATAILETALSTVVTKKSVTPLSLVRAESLIKTASEADKEKDKEKIMTALEDAEAQLQLATLLGYTDEHSEFYKGLSAQITALKQEIVGKNVVDKLYDKLKASVHSLLGKHAQTQDSNDESKKTLETK